jgi:hypothetical protein
MGIGDPAYSIDTLFSQGGLGHRYVEAGKGYILD